MSSDFTSDPARGPRGLVVAGVISALIWVAIILVGYGAWVALQ